MVNMNENKKQKNTEQGQLYLVSTPIGHPDDITLRAINILKEVDEIICEEYKTGSKLIKRLGIEKNLLRLNEHNEEEEIEVIIKKLRSGNSLALISDCGTPVFADPGYHLVQAVIAANIKFTTVPGASSLMAALVSCGFPINEFYFAGFLPRKSEERPEAIAKLANIQTILVIYEAPYRLQPLLKDLTRILGKNLPAAICMNLTQPDEKIHRGNLRELNKYFQENKLKGEFVILINQLEKSKKQHNLTTVRYHKKKH